MCAHSDSVLGRATFYSFCGVAFSRYEFVFPASELGLQAHILVPEWGEGILSDDDPPNTNLWLLPNSQSESSKE